MIMNNTIPLDLSKYGGDGYIEIGYPTLRRLKKAEQAAAALLSKYVNGQQITMTDRLIDADLARKLAYIESAPFSPITVDTFYDFTDTLDAKMRGAGAMLYADILDAIEKVQGGEVSPSPDSPEAENGSSESASSQTN